MIRIFEQKLRFLQIVDIAGPFNVEQFTKIFAQVLMYNNVLGQFVLAKPSKSVQFHLYYTLFPEANDLLEEVQYSLEDIGIKTSLVDATIAGSTYDLYDSSNGWPKRPDYFRGFWTPRSNLLEHKYASRTPSQSVIELSWSFDEPDQVEQSFSSYGIRLYSVIFKWNHLRDGFHAIAQTDRGISLNSFKRKDLTGVNLWNLKLHTEDSLPFHMDINLPTLSEGQLATLIAPIHPAKLSVPVRPYVSYIKDETPSWST